MWKIYYMIEDGLISYKELTQIEYCNLTITKDGKFYFHCNEKDYLVHRPDGPAVEMPCGSKFWMKDGKQHRTNGPAVEQPGTDGRYYLNGVEYKSKKDFLTMANQFGDTGKMKLSADLKVGDVIKIENKGMWNNLTDCDKIIGREIVIDHITNGRPFFKMEADPPRLIYVDDTVFPFEFIREAATTTMADIKADFIAAPPKKKRRTRLEKQLSDVVKYKNEIVGDLYNHIALKLKPQSRFMLMAALIEEFGNKDPDVFDTVHYLI